MQTPSLTSLTAATNSRPSASQAAATGTEISAESGVPETADPAAIGAFVAALLEQLNRNDPPAAATAPRQAAPLDTDEVATPGADTAADVFLLPGHDPAATVQALPTVPGSKLPSAALLSARVVASGARLDIRATLTAGHTADAGAGAAVAAAEPLDFDMDVADLLSSRTLTRDAGPVADVIAGARESGLVPATGGSSDSAPSAAYGRTLDPVQHAVATASKHAVLPATQPEVFGERLQQQIAIMVSQNAQHARLAVNPVDLGPVEVHVSVVGDEATVHLAAANAATREMLEEALPRLRSAFADSGVVLGEANVSADMPGRGGAQPAFGDAATAAGHGNELAGDDDDLTAQPLRMVRLGLVDAFV